MYVLSKISLYTQYENIATMIKYSVSQMVAIPVIVGLMDYQVAQKLHVLVIKLYHSFVILVLMAIILTASLVNAMKYRLVEESIIAQGMIF